MLSPYQVYVKTLAVQSSGWAVTRSLRWSEMNRNVEVTEGSEHRTSLASGLWDKTHVEVSCPIPVWGWCPVHEAGGQWREENYKSPPPMTPSDSWNYILRTTLEEIINTQKVNYWGVTASWNSACFPAFSKFKKHSSDLRRTSIVGDETSSDWPLLIVAGTASR